MNNDRVLLVLKSPLGRDFIFERLGDGDYRPSVISVPTEPAARYQIIPAPGPLWRITTGDFDLGAVLDPTFGTSAPPALTQFSDACVFMTSIHNRPWEFAITGLNTLHPLSSGTIQWPANP